LDATPIGIAEQGVSIEYVLTNIVWMVFAERLRTVERRPHKLTPEGMDCTALSVRIIAGFSGVDQPKGYTMGAA